MRHESLSFRTICSRSYKLRCWEAHCQARSTADWQGGEGCPCKRDESYLINIYWADEAINSTSTPELGMGERRGQG